MHLRALPLQLSLLDRTTGQLYQVPAQQLMKAALPLLRFRDLLRHLTVPLLHGIIWFKSFLLLLLRHLLRHFFFNSFFFHSSGIRDSGRQLVVFRALPLLLLRQLQQRDQALARDNTALSFQLLLPQLQFQALAQHKAVMCLPLLLPLPPSTQALFRALVLL